MDFLVQYIVSGMKTALVLLTIEKNTENFENQYNWFWNDSNNISKYV